MDPTSKEGIYTKLNRHGKKVFVARFKIKGKTYRPVLGSAPQMNLREAVAKREELIKEKKGYKVHRGKTIDVLFDQYVAYRKDSLSKSWHVNIVRNYNKHLRDVIGMKYPNNVLLEDIQYLIDYHLGEKESKPEKILKTSTVKQFKDCISGLYKYLIEQGKKETLKEVRSGQEIVTEKVTVNIGHMLEIPKFDNKIYFTISEVQAENLYNTIINYEDLIWRTYFIFLLHGRRKMEVAAMRWEWIDFHYMHYSIPAEKNKGQKMITAPMTVFLKDALENIGIKVEGFIFEGTGITGHIGSTGIDYQWRKLRGLAGMHSMRLHDIRHLIGYLAVNNGHTLEQIGYVLGHTSTATTKRYSNLKSKGAASVLNTVFDQLSGNDDPQ